MTTFVKLTAHGKAEVCEAHFREILRGASVAFVFKVLGTAAAFVVKTCAPVTIDLSPMRYPS